MKKENSDFFYNIIRPSVRGLEAYDPGPVPSGCVRLSANENSRGVSSKAYLAMAEALKAGNRYPDSRCGELRRKIADFHGLDAEQVLVGNGLDGVFTVLGRAMLDPLDEVICGELTFSVYADTAKIMGALPVAVSMTDAMALDVDGFIGAITDKTKMICFCNPNNPTGTAAPIEDIVRMLDAVPEDVIFVLDEAYIEFADEPLPTGLKLLDRYRNLIVCRTFSKIYGLAGMRVGWIAAHPELIKHLYKVREPYCVSAAAAAGAAAALDDREFFEQSRAMLVGEREKLCRFFFEKGIPFVPSQGNFILLSSSESFAALTNALSKNNIAARPLSFRGGKLLRVSVGLPEENRILEMAVEEALCGRFSVTDA